MIPRYGHLLLCLFLHDALAYTHPVCHYAGREFVGGGDLENIDCPPFGGDVSIAFTLRQNKHVYFARVLFAEGANVNTLFVSLNSGVMRLKVGGTKLDASSAVVDGATRRYLIQIGSSPAFYKIFGDGGQVLAEATDKEVPDVGVRDVIVGKYYTDPVKTYEGLISDLRIYEGIVSWATATAPLKSNATMSSTLAWSAESTTTAIMTSTGAESSRSESGMSASSSGMRSSISPAEASGTDFAATSPLTGATSASPEDATTVSSTQVSLSPGTTQGHGSATSPAPQGMSASSEETTEGSLRGVDTSTGPAPQGVSATLDITTEGVGPRSAASATSSAATSAAPASHGTGTSVEATMEGGTEALGSATSADSGMTSATESGTAVLSSTVGTTGLAAGTSPSSPASSSSTTTGSSSAYILGPDGDRVQVKLLVRGVDAALLESSAASKEAFMAAVKEGTLEAAASSTGSAPVWLGQRLLGQLGRRLLGASGGIVVVAELAPPDGAPASELAAVLEAKEVERAVERRLQDLIPAAGAAIEVEALVTLLSAEAAAEAAAVEKLLPALEAAKEGSFAALAGGASNVTVAVPGLGQLFAGRLQSLPRSVRSGPVALELPEAIFALEGPGGPLVLSALVVEPGAARSLGSVAAVVLDLQTLEDKRDVAVEALQEPVALTLPVAFNDSQLACAYWDEQGRSWSRRGVRVSGSAVKGQDLLCETFHFSLFGAILQGIVSTVTCANFDLLREERVEMLFKGDWHQSLGALACFSLLATLLLFLLLAALLDCHRKRRYQWKDEFFLVVTTATPSAASSGGMLASDASGAAAVATGCCACGGAMIEAMKEALDDIVSNWFEHFAQVREVCSQALEVLSGVCSSQSGLGLVAALRHASDKLVTKLLLSHSRRGMAASLAMSTDLVDFVLQDEELRDFLTEEGHARRAQRFSSQSGSQELTESQAATPRTRGSWREAPEQFQAWRSLRQEVCEALHSRIAEQQSHLQHVLSICEIYALENPVGALFAVDIFQSAKQKVALFSADLLGSLVLCAVFFQGGGMVRGRPVGEEEMCGGEDDGGVGFRIGRFIVIATASVLLAGLPVGLLQSLMTKTLKRTSVERAPSQLRAWRLQERLFWLVAMLYNGFCAFYLLVFVANIGNADHEDWSLAGALGLLEDLLAFPLLIAAALPLAARLGLKAHAWAHKVPQEVVVRRACERLQNNTMMAVEEV